MEKVSIATRHVYDFFTLIEKCPLEFLEESEKQLLDVLEVMEDVMEELVAALEESVSYETDWELLETLTEILNGLLIEANRVVDVMDSVVDNIQK